ncbi:MAG: hypothetical protein HGB22_11290 [Chlorobiaceae bacterium]|nr:hypothetical protein [Chlorobiaceae bacterium]
MILESNEKWGTAVDDQGVVHAIWLADLEATRNPTRLMDVLANIEAQGKMIENNDYVAAVKGRCRVIDGGAANGCMLILPSYPAAVTPKKPRWKFWDTRYAV